MSISSSLFTGASGLDAHGEAINTVGNNIANVSTIGYQASRASFADVLGGDGPGGTPVGDGVFAGPSQTLFGQGSLQQTGNPLDMAVSGNGFFVVAGQHGSTTGSFYTRDGRFHLDNTGNIVNPQGLALQGYMIDPSGTMATATSDLDVAGAQSPPTETTHMQIAVNLDSTAQPPAAAFDPANPGTTSNYSTSINVYDSLGNQHRADVYFRTDGAGGWEYHVMVDGGDVGQTAGTPTEIATGTLSFGTDGKLSVANTTPATVAFTGADPNQTINFDFGAQPGSTQFAAPFSVNQTNQDGFASGSLTGVAVGSDGTVTGTFSNGQSRPLARVALAGFTSENGLKQIGDQLYQSTTASGNPLIDPAATGGRGSVTGGALEGSNVDIATEMVTLISYQRAYQANAKTVSTADELLQTVDNLKQG
jgi:flagellar hook protein FlgE